MTPVEWLERNYNEMFHENRRTSVRQDLDLPLAYYAYQRPYEQGAGSGAYTPMFSLKTDDTPHEQMFFRHINVVA